MPRTYCWRMLGVALIALLSTTACEYKGGDDEPDQKEEASAADEEADEQGSDEEADDEQEPADKADRRADDGDDRGEEEASGDKLDGADDLGEGTQEQKNLLAEAKQAFLTNETDKAEEAFKKLVDTEPVSGPQVSGVIALAQLYIESGRADKAMELYEDLPDKAAQLAELQLVVARSLGEQGKYEEAIEMYERLLENKPDFIFALVELGNAYAEAGDEDRGAKALARYEKRVQQFSETLESEETGEEKRLYLLDVFSLLNDARANQAVAEALDNGSPPVRAKAARVLAQTGAVETREDLEKAAEEDPEREVQTAAEQALEELERINEATGGRELQSSDVEEEHELSDVIREERGEEDSE